MYEAIISSGVRFTRDTLVIHPLEPFEFFSCHSCWRSVVRRPSENNQLVPSLVRTRVRHRRNFKYPFAVTRAIRIKETNRSRFEIMQTRAQLSRRADVGDSTHVATVS